MGVSAVSKSRDKGTFAESATVQYLRTNGFPYADRRPLSGAKDKGDILVAPGVIFEVKSQKKMQLGPWLRETEVERVNANAEYAFLVMKPEGVGVTKTGKWLAATYMWMWNRMILQAWPGADSAAIARVMSGSSMSGLMEELAMSQSSAHEYNLPFYSVQVRPRGHSHDPENWYMVTHLSALLSTLRAAGYGDEIYEVVNA